MTAERAAATSCNLGWHLQGHDFDQDGEISDSELICVRQIVDVESTPSVDELQDVFGFDYPQASVLRMYQAYFGRQPDLEGAKYWIDVEQHQRIRADHYWAMSETESLHLIATYFANSEEFNGTYQALDDHDFVNEVYLNVMARLPDTAGRDYWMEQLAEGLSRADLVFWFSLSEEFVDRHSYQMRWLENNDHPGFVAPWV